MHSSQTKQQLPRKANEPLTQVFVFITVGTRLISCSSDSNFYTQIHCRASCVWVGFFQNGFSIWMQAWHTVVRITSHSSTDGGVSVYRTGESCDQQPISPWNCFPCPREPTDQPLTSPADGSGGTGSFALLLRPMSHNRALRGAQACPNVSGPQLPFPSSWSVYQQAAE